MKRRNFLKLFGSVATLAASAPNKLIEVDSPEPKPKITKDTIFHIWDFGVVEPGISLATRAEAEAGTTNGVYMTPEKVRRLSEQLGEFYSLPHPIRNLPS